MPAKKKTEDAKGFIARQMAGAAKQKRSRQSEYGKFANEREEQLFKIIAQNDPTPVGVANRDWKTLADAAVNDGYLSCAITPTGSTYRLTEKGRGRLA
jgi:hypothetical protein